MPYLEPNIPFEQSPNYNVGDGKIPKIGYVLHATLGRFIGAKETLKAAVRKDAQGRDLGRASCHLLISEKDHEWVELVRIKDIAWHAGKIDAPDPLGQKALLKDSAGKYINPNGYLLGIEVCCGWDTNKNGKVDIAELNMTEWQYEACAQYLARNEVVHGIKIDPKFCIGHTNLTSYKSDNMYRHWNRIINRAQEIIKQAITPPTPKTSPESHFEPSGCVPAGEVAKIKESVKNKEVLGLFQIIKRLFS